MGEIMEFIFPGIGIFPYFGGIIGSSYITKSLTDK